MRDMTLMNIVLFGAAGAGKTTLAKALTLRNSQLARISSGDIAREIAESDDTTRRQLESGHMAPEDTMRRLVRERMRHIERSGQSWILDGFPRTLPQLVLVMQWTDSLPTFLLLDVGFATSLERLTDRNRHDDNADAIAGRITQFTHFQRQAINPLHKAGLIDTLDGTKTTAALADHVEQLIQLRAH